MIRVLFLGQKPLAEEGYRLLVGAQDDQFRLCGAVSNTERSSWWGTNGIAEHAIAAGIPFVSSARRHHDRIREVIESERINTLISLQHSWILPADILAMVGGRAFNVHNAKLPDYKGHNTITHAILNGERRYTSTLHWMVPEVDMGPLASEAQVEIAPDETAWSLYQKTRGAVRVMFSDFVALLKSGEPIPSTPIVGEGRFYGKHEIIALKEIRDLGDPAEVDLKSRAFYFPPFEPAYAIVRGKRVYVTPEYQSTR